jgi:hypothetical protein
MSNLIVRPGITDLFCLVLLMLASLAGFILEPEQRDFWLGIPLLVEIPLLCTVLLLLPRSIIAGQIAAAIHILMFIGCGLCVAFCFFLLVTILFAGMAFVLGPIAVLLALNSLYTLSRIRAANAAARASLSTGSQVA